VVSFTPLLLYYRGRSPRFTLDRRLGGPQSRSKHCGEKKILDPTGNRTPALRRPASSRSLYRLRYPVQCHWRSRCKGPPLIHFFFPLALQPTFGPWPISMKLSVSLQFTRSWKFDRTPWTGDQLVARPLPVHKHRKTHIHKH
jgi:hypothetical protein